MDLSSIERAVSLLPREFEPLLLGFLAPPLQVRAAAVTIGTDGGTDLRVDLRTGHVFSEDGSNSSTRFVNSSVDAFRAFIDAYADYCARVRTITDEEAAQTLVEALRTKLAFLDQHATADPESWWSIILEQAGDGLL